MTQELTGEKCDDMPTMAGSPMPYRPGGGAESFAELFAYRDAQTTENTYYMATGDYRDLSNNILNDPELSASEKADKLVALTNEFQQVVQNAPDLYAIKEAVEEGEKAKSPSILRSALKTLKNVLVGSKDDEEVEEMPEGDKAVWTTAYENNLPDSAFLYIEPGGTKTDGKTDGAHRHFPYKDASGKVDLPHLRNALARIPQSNVPAEAKAAATKKAQGILADQKTLVEEMLDGGMPTGFKVIDSPTGPRWLAFSSNAFEDKEQELFSTKAHEEAIAFADKTGNHGPLRLYHVNGADIGDADFQALAGRFLLESGTFRDDAYGKAAVKYFKEHPDEQFQVSIGYWYKEGDDADGTYDWLRYRERSLCPMGKAANPFTGFVFGEIGEKTVDANKAKMLTDILGADLAQTVISRAETATKELEANGVRFKELSEAKGIKEDMEAMMADMTPEQKAKMQAIMAKLPDGTVPAKKDDEAATVEGSPVASVETVPADDSPVMAAIAKLTETVGTLAESITSVQGEVKAIKDDAQKRQENAPRALASMFRESGSQGREIDPSKVKELTGEKEDPPANPVTPYIMDFIGANR